MNTPKTRRPSRLPLTWVKTWLWLPALALSLLLLPAAAGLLHAQPEKPGREAQEKSLLILRNGGRVAGITPQTGGRIVLYRSEAGPNMLDERPELWGEATPTDMSVRPWKQYYGESAWAGPQSDWWSSREPYPPEPLPAKAGQPPAASPHWPPDPSWEMGDYKVVRRSESRVVLQSPVSALTGLQLTKTVELRPDGILVLQVSAVNRGDRVVTRNLWMLTRVPLSVRCFVPVTEEKVEEGFTKIASISKHQGITDFIINRGPGEATGSGKLAGTGSAGWMATATHEQFFIIRFPLIESSKVPPGCTPIIVFCTTIWPVLELEHHGPLTELKPGQSMTREQTWQIIPNPGLASAEEQSRFLRTKVLPELP